MKRSGLFLLIVLFFLTGCATFPSFKRMEDTGGKISDYTQASSAALTDVLVGTDVSDLTMSSDGTTKKFRIQEIADAILADMVEGDLPSTVVVESDVDDTPSNGATTDPVSSNWAYGHENAADPHTIYMLESNIGIGANNYLQIDATAGAPNDDEYVRFTASGIEGRTEAEFKADFNLEAGTDYYSISGADSAFQPLEATLTDIADGTIAENLVNTANPWAVNEGGTGSGTASGARTNLGLVIGTNVLAPDGDGASLTNVLHDIVDDTTPQLGGDLDMNGNVQTDATGIDDDDCTGDQGKFWWDSTDNQWEFCNANSGTPIVVGSGAGGLPTTGGTMTGNITMDDGSGASPDIIFTDETNETATFEKADSGFLGLTTQAADGLNILVGNLKVGNGTPTNALDGEDLYVEGDAEVDGSITAAGLDLGTADNPTFTLDETDGTDWQIRVDDTGNSLEFGSSQGGIGDNVEFELGENGDGTLTGDLSVLGSDLTLGAAGVQMTGDGDGAITFLGLGDGSDEDLTINLDDIANTVTFSSSTGVTDLNFSAMNISTTGVIKGRASYGTDITGAVSHDTTATHGVFYHFTAAATVTLDAAADAGYGAQVCYRVRDAAEAAVIDIDASEKINLAGTALAAGTAITATGAGETVCLVATTDSDGSGTDGWETWGATSGWASE